MNAIEVRGLSKKYPAFELKNVSFEVPEGSIMGFIGRNGAGKSTTLKSMLGLVHADGGDVRMLGMDVAAQEKEIKESLGVVLGGIDFYPKKKIKAITAATRKFYPQWSDEKYQYYCKLFDIDETKRVDQLSSGMKVKYLIALALCHDAKILIMDEPTSGLDPVSRDDLTELFSQIVKDGSRSILFSTHITSDLEKCASHITFIKDGEIQHTGTMHAFMDHYKEYGSTLEEIIVKAERRGYDEGTII